MENKVRDGFQKGHSLHIKFFIIPAAITVLLVAVYTFVLQKNFSDETLNAGLKMNIARSDAVYSLLADDFCRSDFTELSDDSAMDTQRYQELQKRLNELRRINEIRYLYIAGRSEDGTLIYLVDGLDLGAPDFAYPGTAIESEMIPYIETALSGEKIYSRDIVDTTWGHIYTACYPVFANDNSGDVIGALCIETDMESIYSFINSGNRRVILLAVIAAAIVVALCVFVFTLLRRNRNRELAQNKALQDMVRKLQEREVILDALSIDFDSVYFCDLVADTTQIIKEESANYDPLAYKILGDNTYSYSNRTVGYFENFVEKESAPDLLEKMSAAYLMDYLSSHSHMTCRFRVKPNPTGKIYVETKIVPVDSDEGFKVVMGFHFIDDIVTEQERHKAQLEQALFETRKNNEIISAIARIYETIYYIDLTDHTYEKIAAGKNSSGADAENNGSIDGLLMRTLERFVAPEWQTEMKVFLDCSTLPERLRGRNSVTAEYQRKNGSWYRARFIIKNRDDSGAATGALFAAREITYEKQQELELKQRLKDSAEEAERANASKTDFLRRMSHDVRTPINGIRGMVEIANYYPNDLQKQKECRDKIWESTGHLLSLVNNILDMNKLESGRIDLQHKPFDLFRVLSETSAISEMQAIEHNVRFVCGENDRQIVHNRLIGSETHLKQIILNFTSNAVKYNREGGSVTLSCREVSSDENTAAFEFLCDDTGIGMSEEFQKHAFDPFAQEEKDDVRTRYAGSGLGLSIAKQLVELMGGTIELRSNSGTGTSVRFTLSFDIDKEPQESGSYQPLTGLRMEGVHALLAEDNELNAEIAEFLLDKYGISVTRAENGERAVEIFMESQPGSINVIFMDVMMPVMGGLEATRAIRSLDRADAKTIPIFAMTANAFTDDIQRSYDAGMNEHLTKPLQENEIIAALHKYVDVSKKS